MTLAGMICRALRGREAEQRREAVERETEAAGARIRQSVQTIQSGSRVMTTMAGMMTMMTDKDER